MKSCHPPGPTDPLGLSRTQLLPSPPAGASSSCSSSSLNSSYTASTVLPQGLCTGCAKNFLLQIYAGLFHPPNLILCSNVLFSARDCLTSLYKSTIPNLVPIPVLCFISSQHPLLPVYTPEYSIFTRVPIRAPLEYEHENRRIYISIEYEREDFCSLL